LPTAEVRADMHCVTEWSKPDTRWTDVSVDTLFDGVETRARPTARAAPLLLEERELGPRVALTPQDEPGFRHRASVVKDHHD
jgi:hypothetical protein